MVYVYFHILRGLEMSPGIQGAGWIREKLQEDTGLYGREEEDEL
jgi:hypothetical protein